eukprot:353265-Chlamydomonas_euryale.AAC.3
MRTSLNGAICAWLCMAVAAVTSACRHSCSCAKNAAASLGSIVTFVTIDNECPVPPTLAPSAEEAAVAMEPRLRFQRSATPGLGRPVYYDALHSPRCCGHPVVVAVLAPLRTFVVGPGTAQAPPSVGVALPPASL